MLCGRPFGLALIVFTVTVAAPLSQAATLDPTPRRGAEIFDGLLVIERNELAAMRGRFITAAGLVLDLRANVRTFVNETLVLETQVTLTESSVSVKQIAPPDRLTSGIAGVTFVMGNDSGTGIVESTPASIDLSGLAGATDIVLNDEGGFTAALHKISSDQILNVIINTGENRVVKQQMDMFVTIKNFAQFQQDVHAAVLGRRLADALR